MNGSLPVDMRGTVKLPKIPTKELIGDFFQAKHINDELLCEHFLGMINEMFTGIASHDHEAIKKVAEATFAKRLISETTGLKISYTKPSDDALDKVYLIDKMFIKGVNAVRSENDTNADYIAENSLESIGIRNYIHKFHLGLQPYYFKLQYENELAMMNDE